VGIGEIGLQQKGTLVQHYGFRDPASLMMPDCITKCTRRRIGKAMRAFWLTWVLAILRQIDRARP
jgi:hypothetical protein